MDCAAKLDFALDVDHLAFAEAGGGGDAHRLGEGEIAEIEDRQSVHLPDGRAIGGYQHLAAQDRFLDLGAQAAGAVALGVDCALDRGGADGGAAGVACAMVGFVQQFDHALDIGGDFARVAGGARAEIEHARHRVAFERQQLVAARPRGDEAGEQQVGFRAAFQVLLEVGGDAKQPAEIRVVGLQQIKQQPLADEDYLQLERYRLGLERQRAHQAVDLAQGFDMDLMAQ